MPRHRLTTAGPGRPKGRLNDATLEIKKLSTDLTTGNPLWVAATKVRLEEGKESPGVVQTLLYYAHGKPKETVGLEVNDSLADLLRLALAKAAS